MFIKSAGDFNWGTDPRHSGTNDDRFVIITYPGSRAIGAGKRGVSNFIPKGCKWGQVYILHF